MLKINIKLGELVFVLFLIRKMLETTGSVEGGGGGEKNGSIERGYVVWKRKKMVFL